MVDSAEGSQGVVAEAEVWVVDLHGALQGKEDRSLVCHLWDAVIDPRYQQHMAVLDGGHVDEHKIRGRCACGLGVVVRVAHCTSCELKQHFLHRGLLEVELASVKRLHDLVHTEFGRSFLGCTTLIQLCDEAVDSIRHLNHEPQSTHRAGPIAHAHR